MAGEGCGVVFADPDNGLIVPSAEGGVRSGKYALPSELADYYRAGASVIYYQHQARRRDGFYTEQHLRLLESAFPGAAGLGLKFCTMSRRYYFFAMQPAHEARLRACVCRMLQTPWQRHFRLVLA